MMINSLNLMFTLKISSILVESGYILTSANAIKLKMTYYSANPF